MTLEINKIHCGDSVLLMKEIEDKSVELTVTSPPYDNLRDYEGYVFNFEPLAKELYRVTKEGGVVVWVVGDATVKGSETGTSFKQALYFKEIGFNLHDTMIYNKNCLGPCGSDFCYTQSFEYMFVFSKNTYPKTINLIKVWNKNYKGKTYSVQKHRRRKDGKTCDDRIVQQSEYIKKNNIWTFSNINETDHPAPFPEKLAQDHIISWSNEGDLVLDPMCGSGTTCKMAYLLKRKWIGIDISEKYCNISRQRLAEAMRQRRIF